MSVSENGQVNTARWRDISVTVNGRTYERRVPVRKTLADFIREDVGLTGTHTGCEHGVCGACTIRVNGQIVRSCLGFAVQFNGSDITTIEGVDPELAHPVQKAFREHHGLQCGYCTPGMLLTAIDLLERYPEPSEELVRSELSGNLCRCTGYQGIVDAVLAASKVGRGSDGGSR